MRYSLEPPRVPRPDGHVLSALESATRMIALAEDQAQKIIESCRASMESEKNRQWEESVKRAKEEILRDLGLSIALREYLFTSLQTELADLVGAICAEILGQHVGASSQAIQHTVSDALEMARSCASAVVELCPKDFADLSPQSPFPTWVKVKESRDLSPGEARIVLPNAEIELSIWARLDAVLDLLTFSREELRDALQ